MNFNDEDFLRRIVGVGTLGYSLEKIMNVLDMSFTIRIVKSIEHTRKE